MGRRTVGGALLAMLIAASQAFAGAVGPPPDRYASPTGGGPEPCAESAPCSLDNAVGGTGAVDGSRVHLAGGTYTSQLGVNRANMTVEGPASGTRAHVQTTGGAAAVVFQSGVVLRDLDVTANNAGGSAGALSVNPGRTGLTFERLRVTATGTTAFGVVMRGGATSVLRDSFVTSDASSGAAIVGGGAGSNIVNVTARAVNAGSRGLLLDGNYMDVAATQTTTVVNSILQGATYDLEVEGTPGHDARLDVDHSNWQTSYVAPANSQLVEGAGNQKTGDAVFELDGVRQASSSPTINAGRTLAQLGTKDLFGGARPSGTAPDIGAHEVQEAVAVVPDPDPKPLPTTTTTTTTTTTPAGTTPPAADVTSPVLGSFMLSARRFRVGTAPTALAAQRRAPRGTAFGWTLSEPATVAIAIERRLAGLRVRRSGRTVCLRATAALRRSLRGKPQRRCTLYRTAGTLRRKAGTGPSTLVFSGRLGSRALAIGAYRATIVATDAAGNRSPARRLTFTIVRR